MPSGARWPFDRSTRQKVSALCEGHLPAWMRTYGADRVLWHALSAWRAGTAAERCGVGFYLVLLGVLDLHALGRVDLRFYGVIGVASALRRLARLLH